MAMTALPIQPLPVYSKAECDMAAVPSAVQSAGRCSVCHFAHARPTMPSISLVGASVSEPPLVDSTDALSRYIDI